MPKHRKKKKKTKEPLPPIVFILGTGISFLLVFRAPVLIEQAQYQFNESIQFGPKVSEIQLELIQMDPDSLYIASPPITAPIVFTNAKSEVAFQRALQNGVVHYPETALVGKPGNMYIFGHSSDLLWAKGNFKTVFALLPDIEQGQEIIVTDSTGHPYIYRAFETEIVDPTDISVLDQYNNDISILTLQTSYPVGTALQRFVVRARLIEGPVAIEPINQARESTP